MTLHWDTGRNADTALFMVGGVIPLHLRAEDGAWAVRGVDGRRMTGSASSRADAKLECLKTVDATLRLGVNDVGEAVRELTS